MSKKYTAKELKSIIRQSCDRGYSLIANVKQEIARLNLTPEELQICDNSNERVNSARRLLSIIASISETLMPEFEISLVLCAQENLAFIAQVQEQHKQYLQTIQSLPIKKSEQPIEPIAEEVQ